MTGRGSSQNDATAEAVSRGIRLAERDETAIVLPGGARIALLVWHGVGADHDDFAAIGALDDGDVMRLTEAAVNRLRTDVAPAVWQRERPDWQPVTRLRRLLRSLDPAPRIGLGVSSSTTSPDSWGTQHNPEYNAAQTELTYSRSGPTDRPLGAPVGPDVSIGRPTRHSLGPAPVGGRLRPSRPDAPASHRGLNPRIQDKRPPPVLARHTQASCITTSPSLLPTEAERV